MHNQDQTADPIEIAGPAEAHQRDGGNVMHKHLPKVLASHVEELAHAQRPVERQRNHVVPPDIVADGLVRVAVPAAVDVP